MKKHDFTLFFEGVDLLTDENLDALYEAGCDDATFGERSGAQDAIFHREAPNLAAAVMSAIEAVEAAVPGVIVTRVEPDDLITASAIAKRVGRSRESVRLLIEGKRGPGGFPPPVPWIDGARLWEWTEVAHWFGSALSESVPRGVGGEFIAALNGALEVRRREPQLSDREEREAVARIVRQDAALLGLEPKATDPKAAKPKTAKPKTVKPKTAKPIAA